MPKRNTIVGRRYAVVWGPCDGAPAASLQRVASDRQTSSTRTTTFNEPPLETIVLPLSGEDARRWLKTYLSDLSVTQYEDALEALTSEWPRDS